MRFADDVRLPHNEARASRKPSLNVMLQTTLTRPEWALVRVMKRAPALVELSRRDFCAFACLGITLAAGCLESGSGSVQTGGLDGTSNGNGPDAGSGSVVHPDGSVATTDGGTTSAATCSGTYHDVGARSTYTLNTPKYVSTIGMFVIKDAGGYYALTARCTHQGVTLNSQTTKFHCPAHGADFTFTGAVIDGPTSTPLQAYAMCTLANGNLGVETTTKVASTVRLVA
jgi:Rieske Fe-S protein